MFRYSPLLRSSPQHLQQRRVRRGRRSPRRTPAQTSPRSKQSSTRSLGLQAISTGLGHRATGINKQQAWCGTSGSLDELWNTILADEASGRSFQRLLLRRRVLRIAIVSVARDLLLVNEMCRGPEPLSLLLRLKEKQNDLRKTEEEEFEMKKHFFVWRTRIAWHHHHHHFLFALSSV